jgi:TRAP-type mannitol/chloroaromatic compound transport system permease small subunit
MTARESHPGTTPLRGLRAVSRFILVAGGLLIVAAAVLIVAEIVMRQVFKTSLGGVDELAGFALAIGSAWSFGSVLLEKAHVRIDTVYTNFGDRGRAVFDVFGLVGTALFNAMLVYFSTGVVMSSLRFGATSQSSLAIPKSIPQALWLAGLVWFLLMSVVLLVLCLFALFRRDWRRVGLLGGAAMLEAELRAEIADTASRNGDEYREIAR